MVSPLEYEEHKDSQRKANNLKDDLVVELEEIFRINFLWIVYLFSQTQIGHDNGRVIVENKALVSLANLIFKLKDKFIDESEEEVIWDVEKLIKFIGRLQDLLKKSNCGVSIIECLLVATNEDNINYSLQRIDDEKGNVAKAVVKDWIKEAEAKKNGK